MGVRREKVILELDDDLTSGLVRAAASTALADKAFDRASKSVARFGGDSDAAGKEIDRLSGRMRIAADAAAILAPTIPALGAAAIPALAGVTNQLGYAIIAGGTAALAFQGVGDALKAMNEYGLDPSEANAEKMNEAMAKLGSSGQALVRTLHDLGPELQQLRNLAQSGMFPGVISALDDIETRLPQFQALVLSVSGVLGDLIASGGDQLASSEWDAWFAAVQANAVPILDAMGRSLGHITSGLAQMWQAFLPLSNDFSTVMLQMSRDFHAWADGLSESDGFAAFIDYVRTAGPQVADTLGALASALVQITQAAAPIGGPVLQSIEAFAKAVSAIADSNLGTPIFAALAAFAAYNRVVGLAAAVNGKFAASRTSMALAQRSGLATMKADARQAMSFGAMTRAQVEKQQAATRRLTGTLGKAGLATAGLAVATTGVADKFNIANTASLALMGSLAGPWGAAIGGGIGLTMDLAAANDGLSAAIERANAAATSFDPSAMESALRGLDAQVRDLTTGDGLMDRLSDGWKHYLESDWRNKIGLGGESGTGKAQRALDELTAAQQRVRTEAAQTSAALNAALNRDVAGGANRSVAELNRGLLTAQGYFDRTAALRGFEQSIDDAAETAKKFGNTWNRASRSFNRNAQGARESEAALHAMAQAAQQAINQTTGLERKTTLRRARAQFIGLATAMGVPIGQARKLAQDLIKVDRTRVKPRADLNDEASAKINNLRRLLVTTDGMYATTTVRNRVITEQILVVTRQGAAQQRAHNSIWNPSANAQALGGLWLDNIRYYAYGDIANNHQPELAGPGPTRVWREPETGGEAYIPLANDHRRPRAQAIAAETVRLLGGTAYFANGGLAFATGGTVKNSFTRAEYNRAIGNFDVRGSMSTFEVRRELKAFAREIRRAGGSTGKNFDALSRRLVVVSRRQDATAKSLENLRSAAADAQATARDSFRHDAFGGSLADMVLQLSADGNDAKAMKAAIDKAQSKGLSGGLLTAISTSGNLELAKQLSAASKTDIARYERLYGVRQSATQTLGSEAYGHFVPAIKQQTATVAQLNKTIKTLGTKVEQGAARGIRESAKASKAKGKAK